jgi:hypothetical protein
MRRYSKQPHLWRTSKRLAKLLTVPVESVVEPAPIPRMHRLRERLSAELVETLVSDYQGGASLADLQRKYSLSRGSVQKLLSERGERRRRRSRAQDELALLIDRYEAGLTIREIATEQGWPKTTVQDALKRAGIAMRPAARRESHTVRRKSEV